MFSFPAPVVLNHAPHVQPAEKLVPSALRRANASKASALDTVACRNSAALAQQPAGGAARLRDAMHRSKSPILLIA